MLVVQYYKVRIFFVFSHFPNMKFSYLINNINFYSNLTYFVHVQLYIFFQNKIAKREGKKKILIIETQNFSNV